LFSRSGGYDIRMTLHPPRSFPDLLVERYGDRLDRIGNAIRPLADRLGPGPLKDLLSGTWLGHPLHPVLTDVVIGSWDSALMLDVLGGRSAQGASDALVAIGVVSAGPTALAGWSDWNDTEGDERRLGLVHALGNTVVLTLYAGSWMARRRDHRLLGVALSTAGMGLAAGTAWLGGHLIYERGVGVDNTVFNRLPSTFVEVMDLEDLPDGQPTVVQVEGVPVFLLRRGDDVVALHNTCTHRGGPLHQGTVEGDTVTCPWHGSTFRFEDGEIERGPATVPQPSYEVRVAKGAVQVRAG
jgi:nitrite reductase/ring-hydroxylating ferredoxin subunit/uncharacterized membrane protein